MWQFFWFTYEFSELHSFRSSQSIKDLLTTVSDRIPTAFDTSGTTRTVALDISKVSDRVLHAALLHKLQLYAFYGQVLGLILSFLSNRWLQVDLDGPFFSQEYPVNAAVPQSSIPDPTFFLLYFNDLPVDVICNIVLYDNDAALFSKCDQPSDLQQQLELVFKLESELRDTVSLARKWLPNSNARKTHLFCLTSLITMVLLMWNWTGIFLKKKHVLGWWDCISFLNWIAALTWSPLLKLFLKKLETWFVPWSLFLLRLFFISINIPCGIS